MLQADDRDSLWSALRLWRQEGLTVALVPTMGNLHAGHLALVEAARQEADRVVTSIFVNPTQFGPAEDFGSYPRTLEADRTALEDVGCDLLFMPDQGTMYPYGLDRAVRLQASSDLAGVLEGQSRPGHFDGVVTVVARLFNLVVPDVAVFGDKDYQQLLIVQRMTADLGYGIRIISVPTVREPGGLAMSSRNNYLEQAERESAGRLYAELLEAARKLESGSDHYRQVEQDSAARLERKGLQVDYFAVRRADDLELPRPGERVLRVLAAVRSGQTRLIDNVGVIRVGISGS
jgi:pantoate--beta-alanine ligase